MSVSIERVSFRLSNGRTIDLTMAEVEAMREQLNRFSPIPVMPPFPVFPPVPSVPDNRCPPFTVTSSGTSGKRK